LFNVADGIAKFSSEDVENLRSELNIRRLSNWNRLFQNNIKLAEVWTTQSRTFQEAVSRTRPDDQTAIVVEVWTDARNDIWSPHVSRSAAARCIYDTDKSVITSRTV
jgi:hypothetical protein